MDAVEAWLTDLRQVLNGEPVLAAEVRIGVFYTAVQLSSGEVGVAFTPRELTDTVCCPRSAA
ncbi:MAG: enolase N-terminal-like fold-containing protein, partial [Candidatus Methylomirabilia bacterium]